MCAGDTAFHDLDTVEITLTRAQAADLRRIAQLWVDGACVEGWGGPHSDTAEVIIKQLPKESA